MRELFLLSLACRSGGYSQEAFLSFLKHCLLCSLSGFLWVPQRLPALCRPLGRHSSSFITSLCSESPYFSSSGSSSGEHRGQERPSLTAAPCTDDSSLCHLCLRQDGGRRALQGPEPGLAKTPRDGAMGGPSFCWFCRDPWCLD